MRSRKNWAGRENIQHLEVKEAATLVAMMSTGVTGGESNELIPSKSPGKQ